MEEIINLRKFVYSIKNAVHGTNMTYWVQELFKAGVYAEENYCKICSDTVKSWIREKNTMKCHGSYYFNGNSINFDGIVVFLKKG